MFDAFIKGFASPVRALLYLSQRPRLWLPACLPFFISLLFFAACLYFWQHSGGLEYFLSFIWDSNKGEHAPYWLSLIFNFFSWILFSLFIYLAFSLVGSLLASPFNDYLSRKVLEERGVKNLIEEKILRAAFRALKENLELLGLKLLLLLTLSWFPIINLCLFPLFIGLDFFDYGLAHLCQGWRARIRLLSFHVPNFLGFIFSFSLLFAIPGAFLFLMPLAVIGAALDLKAPVKKLEEKKLF